MSSGNDGVKIDHEDVNVEGILADFFLKKIDMKSSKSDNDGRHKKKSKHKKHKSKKHKRKSSKRSSSTEKIKYTDTLDLGHTSSSEEKDIKRLKKIKKLDGRDSQKLNAYLPISLQTQNVLVSSENNHLIANASAGIEKPYGPSLELLLTGTETASGRKVESDALSDIPLPEPINESLVKNSVSKLPAEQAEYDVNKGNCSKLESSELGDKSVINEVVECKDSVVTNNAEKACSNEPLNTPKESTNITKIIDIDVNLDKPSIESAFKDEKKLKDESSQFRSRSLSKSQKPKHFRSRSRSKGHSRSKSRSRRHSRSLSRSRRHYRSYRSKRHSRSLSRSKRHSRSLSRPKKHSRSRSKVRHRSQSRTKRSRSNYSSCKKRSYSRDHSMSRTRSRRSRSRSKETYRRGKIRKSRSSSHSVKSHRRSRSYSRDCAKSKHDDRKRSRSKSRRHSRSSSGEHSNHKSVRASSKSRTARSSSESTSKQKRKSRSKSKEKESSAKSCKIDQAKILEIAQKNVLSMIEQGTLPVGIPLEHFKKKELVSIKSGGKSVQELTDFCAKLSKKENEVNDEPNQVSDISKKEGDTGFIHHPFKLKEQSLIKLNIKNAVQIPVKTHAEKFAETAKLSSQFPVSSGNQHKQKELEWIPVVTDNSKSDLTVNSAKTAASTISTSPKLKTGAPEVTKCVATIDSSTLITHPVSLIPLPPTSPVKTLSPPSLPPPPVSLPPLPPPPLPPILPPVPQPQFTSSQIIPSNDTNSQLTKINLPSTSNTSLQSFKPVVPLSSVSYPIPSCSNNLSMNTIGSGVIPPTVNQESFFKAPPTPNPKKHFDIASVLSKKLKAQQKLQEDPNNIEALQAIQETEAIVQEWVRSCEVPGMFYGSTQVKLLTREQLSGPKDSHYRVKRTTFYNTSACSSCNPIKNFIVILQQALNLFKKGFAASVENKCCFFKLCGKCVNCYQPQIISFTSAII
ncbi:hypothetical protein TNCT_354572 [Trichonephila clavata]|uniref:Uncharacterized protein n=1 Tax=Trichonephila clavata TaxID=2740835 RepID=A0A8X6L311_TRICU|nr:hypothetical protein TNCT_354572 [Trichonephila clavata]